MCSLISRKVIKNKQISLKVPTSFNSAKRQVNFRFLLQTTCYVYVAVCILFHGCNKLSFLGRLVAQDTQRKRHFIDLNNTVTLVARGFSCAVSGVSLRAKSNPPHARKILWCPGYNTVVISIKPLQILLQKAQFTGFSVAQSTLSHHFFMRCRI